MEGRNYGAECKSWLPKETHGCRGKAHQFIVIGGQICGGDQRQCRLTAGVYSPRLGAKMDGGLTRGLRRCDCRRLLQEKWL